MMQLIRLNCLWVGFLSKNIRESSFCGGNINQGLQFQFTAPLT